MLAGEIVSVYRPEDNQDIAYVSIAIVGATIPTVIPVELSKGLKEGQNIQMTGTQKYQDKKGKLTIKFNGTVVKPLTVREPA